MYLPPEEEFGPFCPERGGKLLVSCPKYEGSLDEKGAARTSRDPEVRGHETSNFMTRRDKRTKSRRLEGDYMYYFSKGNVRYF